MVAISQAPVVSQPEPENYCYFDCTYDVSQSSRYLIIEREIGIAQVQSNKLSAEAAVDHSSMLVENCEDSEAVCACCLKKEIVQYHIAVQAVKASVTVAKTVRYQFVPRISSCANLSNL